MKAIKRSSVISFEAKKEKELRRTLEKLTALEYKTPRVYADNLRSIEQKIEVYEEERYRGALVRARAKSMSLDERPSKRVLGLEKRHARRTHIDVIEVGHASPVV